MDIEDAENKLCLKMMGELSYLAAINRSQVISKDNGCESGEEWGVGVSSKGQRRLVVELDPCWVVEHLNVS